MCIFVCDNIRKIKTNLRSNGNFYFKRVLKITEA